MAPGATRSKIRRLMRFLPVVGCLAVLLWVHGVAADPVAPKRFEPGLVSTGFDDAHVSFSPDGQTLYFLRSSPDFAHWTVLVSRRAGQKWGPAEVAPFSGRWN